MSHFIPFISKKMKIPFKPYKAEDADIFTIDAIHQKYWKDFCDVCYPHFGFENEEDRERTYEQKYDTFRQCHNMLKEYFDWNEELMFKVSEEDLKRFKNAYSLFANLSTKDNATLPMLLVLLRMQQSIWNRLREDRRMMDYVYPRNYFLTYDNYEKYEMGSYEDFPSDEHIMTNIGDLEKRICDDLLNERRWDDGWVREIEDFCYHHTDFEENDKIEWDVTVGELAQKLSGHVLRSFNYALHESFTKFECNVAKGSGDVVKAVVYRLFMTYQSSLPEVKTIFDDYPAHLCMSKMIQTREELINEFKQTKLGAHWFECIMLPEGLEKVGKYLINHRDTISVDEESHFFYLLDEICIMTDILQGNISKYWLNVEFEDAESVQRQDKELKNNPHKVNPVVDAVKEQTDQDNPPSPLNSISPFTSAVIDTTKAEAVIALLRQLMEGKTKPKDVLMPVRAAMDAGVIRRPTWEEFYKEFGSYRLKSKTSFSDYTNPDKSPYTGADFQMMKEKFRQLMSEGQ